MQSGARVMLADDGRFDDFFLESDIAQNLHVQIERAYFLLTEYVFRRRLVVSKVQHEMFKACKLTSKSCQT